jgi:molybdopterin/thiamine biosynthesis adenylyltransferase
MPDSRYAGTNLVDWIGEEGRRKIRKACCAVIGCGALGSASSNLLVRYGLGEVRIIDRDFVELSNLERQILFDESDARMLKPKATAARDRLSAVNSEVRITGIVKDFNSRNAEELLAGVDVVIDGLDNMETRYLVNDVCVKKSIPWVHGACLSSAGIVYNVLPEGPCFRCLYPSHPGPGGTPTCETEGILPSVPQLVGAIQAAEAVKIVCGSENVTKRLLRIDLDQGEFEALTVERLSTCPACGSRLFEYLEGAKASSGVELCARNAVHIAPAREIELDLDSLKEKLSEAGEVSFAGYLLSFRKGNHELVIFPDGRAVVRGTRDVGFAKGLYSKYVGN